MLRGNLMEAEYWRERELVRLQDELETPADLTEGVPMAMLTIMSERLNRL